MTIAELFHELEAPLGDEKAFNAKRIPGALACRVAKDSEAQPALLLSLAPLLQGKPLRSYRLKYLELAHYVKCTVKEGDAIVSDTFTVVRFTSKVPELQNYFLQYAEALVQIIERNPTAEQLAEAMGTLVEIFSLLSDTPAESVQGLWGELFIIESSSDPAALLDFWHANPEDKFDFSSGMEKLEIKCSGLDRAHYFSCEQLSSMCGSRIFIASLFVRQSSSGITVQELINRISAKVMGNFALLNKLHLTSIRTLGRSLEEASNIRLDYETAKESLQFYASDAVPKIDERHIPQEVSEVKFKSSLKTARPTDISALANKGRLLQALG